MLRLLQFQFCFSLMLFAGCTALNNPTPVYTVQVKTLSKHTVQVKAYKLPRGVFRGALFPTEKNPFFDIVINSDYEPGVKIHVPKELICQVDISNQWEFQIVQANADLVTYSAANQEREIKLHIELPIKRNDYVLCAYRTSQGKDVLVFMDMSENIIDNGLFGYVLID